MPGLSECFSGESAENGKLSGRAGHLCRTRWRLPPSLRKLTVAVRRVSLRQFDEPLAGLTRQITWVASDGRRDDSS